MRPQLPPVVGPRLRRLLTVVFGLFGLLAVNSLYLGSVTFIEWSSGASLQAYFYQLMFLMHLLMGLLIVLPAAAFGALHLKNAWRRPNYRAVRAGLALYTTVLLVLASGLVLIRFDFFSIRDPVLRESAYWLHVITPIVVIWLFVLHRLAGKRVRYRPALIWAAAAVVVTAAALIPQVTGNRDASAGLAGPGGPSEHSPFFPALLRTPEDAYLPASLLMMDGYCRDCHQDVHRGWEQSAHRFSSFNNPAYRFSVMNTREMSMDRDGNTHVSRLCAGCHDPVPLLSGAFDDPGFGDEDDPLASAGITCTSCHAITRINSPRGNADYTIAAPEHYPFTFSDNRFLKWLNGQLLKAKPDFHKRTFLKDLHREPAFCGSCHKVHLPPELNGYKWLRGQNHQDSYHLSGVSGHGAMSFYYPPRAVHACAECHMPLTASADFGADYFDESGEVKVHDHQFVGANTALPYLRGAPDWVNEAHRQFLNQALRVDIFGLKSGGSIAGMLTAPLRPELPALAPGGSYLLEIVVRNLRTGHLFTQGTADSNEVWLEVTARAGDAVIGRSGHRSGDGAVDPWSYFLNAYLLDREGQRIDRRNAEDIFTALYDHQIPPGAADVVHYRLDLPAELLGPVTVEVRLNYRKFDTTFLRHFKGDEFVHNDLPVTLIASDEVVFPVEGGAAPTRNHAVDIPTWQRWNDYGIGLLRKDRQGELRQAEHAFGMVEALGRPDGPVNLARVFLREGRLDDAADALARAVASDPPAPPWLITWYTGLVNKQNGQLEAAIGNFRHVLNTDFSSARERGFDFSQDFRVINELGQTLLELAKSERRPDRQDHRDRLLRESMVWFEKTLQFDPENTAAHFNLALVHGLLGDEDRANEHRQLHETFREDDNARDRVVNQHRRTNPAADHAAEAVAVYPLWAEED